MKFLRQLRKRIVVKIATKNYVNAAKLAEKRRLENGKEQQYVISHPDNECALVVCNKKEFLDFRKRQGKTSKDLTLSMLHRACWFRTANKNNVDRLDARDMIKRKQTYIYMVLDSRGLLDRN